jgi:hypothetical protein
MKGKGGRQVGIGFQRVHKPSMGFVLKMLAWDKEVVHSDGLPFLSPFHS